ncbi:MAG: hypothetical protein U0805_18495 [Pirellulales bacterium]
MTANKCQHTRRAVKKRNCPIGVVSGHYGHWIKVVLVAIVEEVIQMAERIDHDVQPNEAHQADNEHLNELPQHVAVNDREHGSRASPGNTEQDAARG